MTTIPVRSLELQVSWASEVNIFPVAQHCEHEKVSINTILFFADNSSDTERESLIQEIDLCRSLEGERNPNIVNFLGYVSRKKD